jgi:hypothetical protein
VESGHIGFVGGIMPPPEAVASGLVAPLTDEDKRTFARWIDLGAPIDLTSSHTEGWHLDDQRPTLVLTTPAIGDDGPIRRVVIGAYDVGSGLDTGSLKVTASVAIDGVRAGANAASRFALVSPGVWEWKLAAPVPAPPRGVTLTVAVADLKGNKTTIVRRIGGKSRTELLRSQR